MTNAIIEKINNEIKEYKDRTKNSADDISDGYHTFGDLYKHRTYLLALAMIHLPYAWKARKHEDGTMFDGMFVVGFPTPNGMVTYHCDNEYWNDFKVPEIPHAPHFNGYSDADVLDREKAFLDSTNTRLVNNTNIDDINKIVINEILPTFDNAVQKAAFITFYNHMPVIWDSNNKG
jgi:hypothetical protein|nr:MAG TPA: hypothetical protein [Caudoviricetes sp.]